jgi:transposase
MQINVIGFDIAKHVFQVHAADNGGQAVAQIRLRRAQVLDYFRSLPPCLVGMEACATAHHWARELMALGHDVRLMPPGYVKAYVKRNKTDAADAEAIAEAVTRPTMRFVPVKSAESQAMLMLHRARELLVRQRTMLANAVRAHLAEFGIIAPQGIHRVEKLATQVHDPAVPPIARDALMLIVDELASIWRRVEALEARSGGRCTELTDGCRQTFDVLAASFAGHDIRAEAPARDSVDARRCRSAASSAIKLVACQ